MDLSASYLGLNLRTPLVVSAAQPLSEEIDNIKRMEDAGASAVVLYSLFEEQLMTEQVEFQEGLSKHTDSFPEALSFFPEPGQFLLGPEEYFSNRGICLVEWAERAGDLLPSRRCDVILEHLAESERRIVWRTSGD